MGYMYVLGPCLLCGRVFTFNPEHVPSIPWKNGRPDPEGTREPICETCIVVVNDRRKSDGLDEWPVHPDAYEPAEA